jgi:hypothetical protein
MKICPACGEIEKKIISIQDHIYICRACECLYGTPILEASFLYVQPNFTPVWKEKKPFDLRCLGEKSVVRRHGWYDPYSKKIIEDRESLLKEKNAEGGGRN